jgi:hypothetical protein
MVLTCRYDRPLQSLRDNASPERDRPGVQRRQERYVICYDDTADNNSVRKQNPRGQIVGPFSHLLNPHFSLLYDFARFTFPGVPTPVSSSQYPAERYYNRGLEGSGNVWSSSPGVGAQGNGAGLNDRHRRLLSLISQG